MNEIFVTADLHLFHNNIIKYENRPFRGVEEMNDEIVKRWNNTVSKHDKVFVLGDVSFGGKEETKEIIERLNGHKTLIMGNHDRPRSITNFWQYVGFNEVCRYPIIYKEFTVMTHEPPSYFNEATPFAYIYGHVHSSDMYKTITKNTACVSMERWDYTPVNIEKIYELMKLV